MEIDHSFICTVIGAPEGDCLVASGLTESAPNVYARQGTANRHFFSTMPCWNCSGSATRQKQSQD
jgi:hypothetical protein